MWLFDKYNCILCKWNKYNKDDDHCWNHYPKDEAGYPIEKCKSLSNIYYGKLVKWFPFNVIDKISYKIDDKKTEKYYDDFNDDYTENSEMKHIWGIRSAWDFSQTKGCNLLSMNDFDITYLKDKKKYILGIETFLSFDEGHDGEKKYLNWILDEFTKWMEENGYKTDKQVPFYCFGDYSLADEFGTLEDAYALFKLYVKGFEYV